VQEQFPVLSDDVSHPRGVKNAVYGSEQRVNDIGVIVHRQVEELDDAIDRQIIISAAARKGITIMNMMFLVLLKSGLRSSETGYLALQVRKDVIFRRDRPSVNVDIAGV
jgi:hypothetical protein